MGEYVIAVIVLILGVVFVVAPVVGYLNLYPNKPNYKTLVVFGFLCIGLAVLIGGFVLSFIWALEVVFR